MSHPGPGEISSTSNSAETLSARRGRRHPPRRNWQEANRIYFFLDRDWRLRSRRISLRFAERGLQPLDVVRTAGVHYVHAPGVNRRAVEHRADAAHDDEIDVVGQEDFEDGPEPKVWIQI